MSFTVTVVHAPGALTAEQWAAARSRAPGAYDHELRLMLDDPGDAVSGANLEHALRAELQVPEARISTRGIDLRTIVADSQLMHSGMVVLISPAEVPISPLRPTQLALCLDSGPDSGRLVPLRRGRTEIGRGRAAVRTADARMSRREAVLDVGTRAITLHRSSNHYDDAPARLLTDEEFQLGSTRCRITMEPPPALPAQAWPPSPEPVQAAPPEGKHKMMLAFALVPLVAGIVLVAFTGMWFFLLFSGASALVASAIFWDGRRKQRRYRRSVADAAHTWASRTYSALCSPGELLRLLRADSATVHAGATGHHSPAVRLGTGQVAAGVDFGSATGPESADTMVEAVAGITLEAGEQTAITGTDREAQRLLRWLIVQLTLSPAQPQVVLIGVRPIPEVRDLARVAQLSTDSFLKLLDSASDTAQSQPPRVLIISDPRHDGRARRAASASWHVISLGSGDPGAGGWAVDLEQRKVERLTPGLSGDLSAEHLQFDGMSDATLGEHLRLALRHHGSAASATEPPASCTHRLPQQMFTETAAEALTAVLGRSNQGPLTLDLVGDGPHILIAGTTGSGKSELLKTLLVSLCAQYGPDELGLVLIDFKGGAAFHSISTLEHSLGLVTDLSQAAAERTLEGIRSELVRRERLFLDAGAGDYGEYRRLRPEQSLSRILVVIDEFRIFSHELPDQLDELMRLATLGRSLGLHLVLSTQRPQGVVTADIRANIGSSICLRVRSEDESRDVIGSPVAASISRGVPGRAVLRTPGGKAVMMQSAQLADHRELRVQPEVHVAQPTPPTNFQDVITAVQHATAAQGQSRTHTPLLPELPRTMSSTDRVPGSSATAPLLARVDDPAGQRQEDLLLDPQNPLSVALIGEVGSGASEAAAAVTAQVLNSPTDTEVHLLDGDRSLAELADHPAVGSWLTEEDSPEVEHLLRALTDELARRRVSGSRTSSGGHRPLMVIVTGYSQWNAASHSRLQSLDHLVGTIASEGPRVGISVMLSGGRDLAVGKLISRFPTRIYLPLGTSEESRYLWPKLRSTDPLCGRGVLLTPHVPPPGLTVHVVTEPPLAPRTPVRHPRPSLQVRALPERLHISEVAGLEEQPGAPYSTPIVGVQQFTGTPARLTLGLVTLILGAPQSGKTNCLRVLHRQLDRSQFMLPGRPPPTQPPETLLVDDAVQCTPEQHSAIQQAVTAGIPVVATASPTSAVFAQLPWAHTARTGGTHVILSPTSRTQADAFATIIPLLPRPIPGRAVHLHPDGPMMVQWALDE